MLILHTAYFREPNHDTYVQHDVEAFVKVDSRGWKTLARTFRPVIERLLEDQIREAGQFVSIMSKLVVRHPNWAVQIAAGQPLLDHQALGRFRELVAQNRVPGASTGRPVVIASSGEDSANPSRR